MVIRNFQADAVAVLVYLRISEQYGNKSTSISGTVVETSVLNQITPAGTLVVTTATRNHAI